MYSCLGNSLPKEREGKREGSLGNVGHAKRLMLKRRVEWK